MSDFIKAMERALNYIEENICEKIDYNEVAKRAYSSSYHFQRVFSTTYGITLGEYIRRRRLTLAGSELLNSKTKVIEVAVKYGYETPESFSRAFYKFHKILPSKVRNGELLKSFSKLTPGDIFNGGKIMDYKIEQKDEKVFVGFKTRFKGVPYGKERMRQEKSFLTTTRAKQWMLIGASCDHTTDYMIISNVTDDGYDFSVAYDLDEWTRDNLFNPEVTGIDFMDKMGFEIIVVPKHTYAIFCTQKQRCPIADYEDIRKSIIDEWLLTNEYAFANAPEVVAMHWRPKGEWAKERYVEIRIPIENK